MTQRFHISLFGTLLVFSFSPASLADTAPTDASPPDAALVETPPADAALPDAAPADASPPNFPSPNGFTSALRIGYAAPLGTMAVFNDIGPSPLSAEFSGQIPFWFDVGYRFAEHFIVGVYLAVGYPFLVKSGNGMAARMCQISGVRSCSGNASVHGGLEFLVKPWPRAVFAPWFGIGAGYETTGFTLKDDVGSGTISYRGWELLNLQLGADYRASPAVAFGPYAAISAGRYNKINISSGNQSIDDIQIANQRMHEWLQFGMRISIDYR